jgi:hypothetical protein
MILDYLALGLLFFVVITLRDREAPPPSASGRSPRRRMGQPVHAARALAVPLDLGDGVSAGTGLGLRRPPAEELARLDAAVARLEERLALLERSPRGEAD